MKSLLSVAGAMDCGDLLTCGECHLVFSLSDIASFIRHKQSTCRGDVQQQDHISDNDDVDVDDDDDDPDGTSCVNGTAHAPAAVHRHGIAEDDKTNGIDKTNFDLHQDEHTSRLGSTSLYNV